VFPTLLCERIAEFIIILELNLEKEEKYFPKVHSGPPLLR